jgi:site-specific recombinase XerD
VERLVDKHITGRVRRHEITGLTARNLRTALYGFADCYGSRPVHRLGRSDVDRYMESIEHLSAATRRARFVAVRLFCRWLVLHGDIRQDPTVGMKAPREPRRKPRSLTTEAVAQLLQFCPDIRAVVIVLLMVQTGLRCCEVSRLQIGDMDRRRRVARIVGKGGHERDVYIPDELNEAVDRYLEQHPTSSGPLIRSYRRPTKPLAADTISGLVASWMWDAGIKHSPRDGVSAHIGRHTCATDMLLGGAHLRDVQYVLGHRWASTTETYIPLEVRGIADAMEGRRYASV